MSEQNEKGPRTGWVMPLLMAGGLAGGVAPQMDAPRAATPSTQNPPLPEIVPFQPQPPMQPMGGGMPPPDMGMMPPDMGMAPPMQPPAGPVPPAAPPLV